MKKMKILLPITFLAVAAAVIIGIIAYNNSDAIKLRNYLELGNKYLYEMDYEQAKAAFESAIEIDPANIDAYRGLTEAYTEAAGETGNPDDFKDAVEICKKAVELFPEDIDIAASTVISYIGCGNYAAAGIQIEDIKAMPADDTSKREAAERIEEHYPDERWEDILAILEWEVEMDPSNEETQEKYIVKLLEIIDDMIEENKLEDAQELIDKSIVEDERITEIREKIAALIEEAEREKAERLKEQEEKQKAAEEEKNIHIWMAENLGLIESYPALCGYSKSDKNVFYIMYGYDVDGYETTYIFEITDNIWRITDRQTYDGKSGEYYVWKTDNVGNEYDMTITDEVRQEYQKYEEKQLQFEEYANKLDAVFKSKKLELTEKFYIRDIKFLDDKDGKMSGVITYWNDDEYCDPYLCLYTTVDIEADEITVTSVEGYPSLDGDRSDYVNTYALTNQDN